MSPRQQSLSYVRNLAVKSGKQEPDERPQLADALLSRRSMQFSLIVILGIISAICYGIVHDQITARVCVEYFTIGHPPVFSTESPTLLAFGWGVLATWWVGLIIGIPLAIAARAGNRPKRTAASLVRPIAILLGVMAICALLAGMLGFNLARHGAVFLTEPLASAVPREKHVPFLADLWAHLASYIVGFVGGIVLIVKTWRSRGVRAVH